MSHQSRVPQVEVHQGGASKRCASSPSPRQLRRCITFEDDLENTRAGETHPLAWGDMAESSPKRDMAVKELLPSPLPTEDTSDWSQLVEGDLGVPPASCVCLGINLWQPV